MFYEGVTHLTRLGHILIKFFLNFIILFDAGFIGVLRQGKCILTFYKLLLDFLLLLKVTIEFLKNYLGV